MEKTKEIRDYLAYRKKLGAIKFAKKIGSNKKAYECYEIGKVTFYKWKKRYELYGEKRLLRKVRIGNFPNQISQEIVALILKIRKEHSMGIWRIKWYLERYHDINISESTVYRTLKRNNIKPLNKAIARQSMGTKRYEKDVPGHHVQIDVKFLIFNDKSS